MKAPRSISQVFPSRPSLQWGELLSYWIARFAIANGLQWCDVATSLGLLPSELSRDFQIGPRARERLSRMSGLPQHVLSEALPLEHLKRVTTYRIDGIVRYRQSPLVLRKSERLQVCWQCLERDAVHKLAWCWAFVVACPEHRQYLTTPRGCENVHMHRTAALVIGREKDCSSGICYERDMARIAPQRVLDAQQWFEKAFYDCKRGGHRNGFDIAMDLVSMTPRAEEAVSLRAVHAVNDGGYRIKGASLFGDAEERSQVIVALYVGLHNAMTGMARLHWL